MAKSPGLIAHIDGASRGNPGPAAWGVVMELSDGSTLTGFSEYLGVATNNVAEYQALLAALEYALNNHYLRIRVRTDSELLALQIQGIYKVKSPGLKPLHQRAQQLIARLESFSIEHVPREQNREADRLANQALEAAEPGKRHQAVAPSPIAPVSGWGGESGVGEQLPDSAAKGAGPLRTSATFRQGLLEPHGQLALFEGEEVDLEIYRKE